MTSRETHLRIALSQAKHTFNEIGCTVNTPLAEQGMEDIERAKQEVDMMKDGPGEREKKELDELVEQLNRMFNSAAPGTAFVLSLEYCKKLQEIWK